jgi:hypothetical protein
VAAHVATLRREAPDVLPSYRAMARRTAERARESGRLAAERAAQILEALQ